jgi:FtsP/CotA-like multicopper oxidase with cupredoxin domain
MWYHDHAIDITAHNALMGLAGLYLLTDPLEEELRKTGSLPPAERDLGLALRDVCLQPITEPSLQHPKLGAQPGQKEARIHFDPFDHDGLLGDFVLVNNVFAPRVQLAPDTWRFRILNASLARF